MRLIGIVGVAVALQSAVMWPCSAMDRTVTASGGWNWDSVLCDLAARGEIDKGECRVVVHPAPVVQAQPLLPARLGSSTLEDRVRALEDRVDALNP